MPYLAFYYDNYATIQIVYGCSEDNGVKETSRNYSFIHFIIKILIDKIN